MPGCLPQCPACNEKMARNGRTVTSSQRWKFSLGHMIMVALAFRSLLPRLRRDDAAKQGLHRPVGRRFFARGAMTLRARPGFVRVGRSHRAVPIPRLSDRATLGLRGLAKAQGHLPCSSSRTGQRLCAVRANSGPLELERPRAASAGLQCPRAAVLGCACLIRRLFPSVIKNRCGLGREKGPRTRKRPENRG